MMIDSDLQPYRLYLGINGISPDLTNSPPDCLLPLRCFGRSLRFRRNRQKENLLRKQEVFFLVTRTGIEPMLPP